MLSWTSHCYLKVGSCSVICIKLYVLHGKFPLLAYKLFHCIVLVNMVRHLSIICFCSLSSTLEQQLDRLIQRNQMSRKLAEQRIAAQMSLEEKCEKAHYVIDNSGDIENTRKQAKRIVGILNDSWEHWRIRFYIAILAVVVFTPILYWYYYC